MANESDRSLDQVEEGGDDELGYQEPPPTRLDEQRAVIPTGNDNEFDDEEALEKPAVTGTGQYENPDEEEAKKRRRRAAIAVGVLLAIVALLLALGLAFRTNTESLRLKTSAPVSAAEPPSVPVIPTKQPTIHTTFVPTQSPIAPTFAPPGARSRLPCTGIRSHSNVTAGVLGGNNFKNYSFTLYQKSEHLDLSIVGENNICGDTYAGYDPDRPDRNYWNADVGRRDCAMLNYPDGFKVCDKVGARRCTADEIANAVGQGSGCGGDNELLWTSTPCEENGVEGVYKVNFALKTNGTFFECENDLTTKTILRCCGDNFAS